MEEEKFKELFVKYAKELLTLDLFEMHICEGKFIEISLVIGDEVVGTVSLDLPRR